MTVSLKELVTPIVTITGISAHSLLSGLSADDHTIYHTDARGDVRYSVENGYEDKAQSTLSFNSGTRTFSHTPSGTCYIWSNGIRYAKSSVETIVIANTEGLHFIYFDASGTLQETTTFLSTIITDFCYVSAVYWDVSNTTQILFTEERHGRIMDSATHSYLHNTIGAVWTSGLDPNSVVADGSGDLAAHAQIGVNNGVIRDEDLTHTITSGSPQTLTAPAAIPFFYRSGASGNWKKLSSTGYVCTTTGSGRMAYNQFTGATWQLTEVGSNNYALMHLIATNDLNNPIIWIVGQNTYTTLSNARNGADSEVNSLGLGGLSTFAQEFVFIATFVIQTATAYANAVKSRIRTLADGVSTYVDFRHTLSGIGGAASASISVSDEGVLKTSSLQSLNFVGPDISVTESSGSVTVTSSPNIFVQSNAPTPPGYPYVWIQTGLGTSGHDITFWYEDGL